MAKNIFMTPMNTIYQLYLSKITRKNRTQEELDIILAYLLGDSNLSLTEMLDSDITVLEFLESLKVLSLRYQNIKGKICGYVIEEIEDINMRKLRCLDKIVDDLSKNKSTEKIIRSIENEN